MGTLWYFESLEDMYDGRFLTGKFPTGHRKVTTKFVLERSALKPTTTVTNLSDLQNEVNVYEMAAQLLHSLIK